MVCNARLRYDLVVVLLSAACIMHAHTSCCWYNNSCWTPAFICVLCVQNLSDKLQHSGIDWSRSGPDRAERSPFASGSPAIRLSCLCRYCSAKKTSLLSSLLKPAETEMYKSALHIPIHALFGKDFLVGRGASFFRARPFWIQSSQSYITLMLCVCTYGQLVNVRQRIALLK